MRYRQINKFVKQLKAYLLLNLPRFIESGVWAEFLQSLATDESGQYHLYDRDHLSIRDLKSFMNMLTAIERATESYSLMALSVFKTLELPSDVLDFYRNYKIFMSTNSVITNYIRSANLYFIANIWPQISMNIRNFIEMMTIENMEKGGEFLIENVFALESYQQKYQQSKKLGFKEEDKSDPSDSALGILIRKNDGFLKKVFKDEYATQFAQENKSESKEMKIDYYREIETKDECVVHVRKLSNAIIGIRKVLEDYDNYKQAGLLSSIGCMSSFVSNLRRVYTLVQDFNHKAIIAEKTGPLAEKIKEKLSELHPLLEKLACMTDDIEGEQLLKENTLLIFVNLIIKQYSQITHELRIHIDYVSQRNTYANARILARQKKIAEIEKQLKDIEYFIEFQATPLALIPFAVQQAMKKFVNDPESDLCVDRKKLDKYSSYLTAAGQAKISPRVFFASSLEYIGNRCNLTLHSQMMKMFCRKQWGLETKKEFLLKRYYKLKNDMEAKPFDNFDLEQLKAPNSENLIAQTLKDHVVKLKTKKESFFTNIPETKQDKPKKIKERLSNQIGLSVQEHGFFSEALVRYEKEKNLKDFVENLMENRKCLSPDSIVLLKEIEDVERLVVRL